MKTVLSTTGTVSYTLKQGPSRTDVIGFPVPGGTCGDAGGRRGSC